MVLLKSNCVDEQSHQYLGCIVSEGEVEEPSVIYVGVYQPNLYQDGSFHQHPTQWIVESIIFNDGGQFIQLIFNLQLHVLEGLSDFVNLGSLHTQYNPREHLLYYRVDFFFVFE